MLKDTIVLIFISVFLLVCWLMNLVLDKIINNESINYKIIGREFIKFIIVLVITITICFTLELIPFLFEKFNIDISANLITPIEIISIVFTLYKSYMVKIFNKIKQLLKKEE